MHRNRIRWILANGHTRDLDYAREVMSNLSLILDQLDAAAKFLEEQTDANANSLYAILEKNR